MASESAKSEAPPAAVANGKTAAAPAGPYRGYPQARQQPTSQYLAFLQGKQAPPATHAPAALPTPGDAVASSAAERLPPAPTPSIQQGDVENDSDGEKAGDPAGTTQQAAPAGETADAPAARPTAPVQPPIVSGTARHQQKSQPAKSTAAAATPPAAVLSILTPVPVPVNLKLPAFTALSGGAHAGETPGSPPGTETGIQHAAPARQDETLDLKPAAALELTIRTQNQTTEPAPVQTVAAPEKPASNTQTQDVTPVNMPEAPASASHAATIQQSLAAPVTAQVVQPAAPAPAAPAQGTPAQPGPVIVATHVAPDMRAGSKPEPPAASPTARPEDPAHEDPKQQSQPLRSLSIDFTPDGAQDVRLRLAEHNGDVHISLHSNDSGLSGRLSDGVHDLVGNLANAGYDAQAWTPGQGRQNQRQYEDQRKNRRNPFTEPGAEPGAEEFGGMMQQPIQEVS